MKHTATCLAAVLAVATFAVAPAPPLQAQVVPGPHPGYLHALSDLRAARHYLHDGWQSRAVKHEDEWAIKEIDKAIDEIKKASIDDGKGDRDEYPVDANLSARDRFGAANQLLYKAMHDLDKAEDVPQAAGLRDRALSHISMAHDIVDKAARTASFE